MFDYLEKCTVCDPDFCFDKILHFYVYKEMKKKSHSLEKALLFTQGHIIM